MNLPVHPCWEHRSAPNQTSGSGETGTDPDHVPKTPKRPGIPDHIEAPLHALGGKMAETRENSIH
jgi:hypothetical protein